MQQQHQKQAESLQENAGGTALAESGGTNAAPKVGTASLWKIVKWFAKTKVSAKKRSFILLREQMCDIIEENRMSLRNMGLEGIEDGDTLQQSQDEDADKILSNNEQKEQYLSQTHHHRNKLLHESENFRMATHEFYESLNLKRMPNYRIRKMTYMQLLQAIYRVLCIQKKVDKSILEFDWKSDAQGQDMMDFDLFFTAMLELTECFCNTQSEDECVTFIRCLHREVARRAQTDNPRSPFIIFRENDMDHSIRLQMTEMQEKMRNLDYQDEHHDETMSAAQQIGFIQFYSEMDSNGGSGEAHENDAPNQEHDRANGHYAGFPNRSQLHQQRPNTHHLTKRPNTRERSQLTMRHESVSHRVPVVTTSRRNSQASIQQQDGSHTKKRSIRKRSQRKQSARRPKQTARRRPHTTEAQQRTEKRYETLLATTTSSSHIAADFPYNDIARQRRQIQSAVNKERRRIHHDNRNIRHKLQSAKPKYWNAAQARKPPSEKTLEQIIGQRKMRSANQSSKSWRNLCSFMEQGLVKPSDL